MPGLIALSYPKISESSASSGLQIKHFAAEFEKNPRTANFSTEKNTQKTVLWLLPVLRR